MRSKQITDIGYYIIFMELSREIDVLDPKCRILIFYYLTLLLSKI